MKKLLAGLLVAFFLFPLVTAGSDQELILTKEEQFHLLYDDAVASVFHTKIPENPRLYADTLTYRDVELTEFSKNIKADKPLKIKSLSVNEAMVPVFELEDGSFLEANTNLVFDDQIVEEGESEASFWLKTDAKIWDSPFVFGSNEAKSKLTAYQKLSASRWAKTFSGLYYYFPDKKGWISEEELYAEEDKFQVVQDLLDTKYKNKKYSIYIEGLEDGQIAQINADQVMYGASIAKLAIIHAAQVQLEDGSLSLSDKLKYSPDVAKYPGAYDTAGAGTISKTPDNKTYTVEDLLRALTRSSDNAASNILGYYLTDENSKEFQSNLTELLGSEWDMVDRDLSAQLSAQMMKEIYHQGGVLIDYLSDTEFDDSRIARDIDVKVAHKTGDAYDFRHDVAIVYAERPFILSIFTDGASHEDISKIAKDVYQILK